VNSRCNLHHNDGTYGGAVSDALGAAIEFLPLVAICERFGWGDRLG